MFILTDEAFSQDEVDLAMALGIINMEEAERLLHVPGVHTLWKQGAEMYPNHAHFCLPHPKCYAALRLVHKDYGGLTQRQAALLLGISTTTLRKRLRSIRACAPAMLRRQVQCV